VREGLGRGFGGGRRGLRREKMRRRKSSQESGKYEMERREGEEQDFSMRHYAFLEGNEAGERRQCERETESKNASEK
jgi:hypothetical protein